MPLDRRNQYGRQGPARTGPEPRERRQGPPETEPRERRQGPPENVYMTPENVIVARTETWRPTDAPAKANGYVLETHRRNADGKVGIPLSMLDAYTLYEGLDLARLARFLAVLLFSKRTHIVLDREALYEPFVGMSPPKNTPSDKISRGGGLNHRGAQDLAAIHVAAIRRVREQSMGIRGNDRPKLRPATEMPQCPFGPRCLMMFYGAFFASLFKVEEEHRYSYTLMTTPKDNQGALVAMMRKAPVYLTGMHCPYTHAEEDGEAHAEAVTSVLGHMMPEYHKFLWRYANGVNTVESPQGVRAAGSITMAEVSQKMSDPDRAHSRMLYTAACSFDNCTDPHLTSWGARAGVFGSLDATETAAYEQWLRGPEPQRVPYLAAFDARGMLGLRPASLPGRQVGPQDDGDPDPPAAPAAPAASAGKSPDAAPVRPPRPPTPPGVRHPIYGRALIPRFVTDKFLDEKGFDFHTYWGLQEESDKQDYIHACVVALFDEFTEARGAETLQIADGLMERALGDPYDLFDMGRAYDAAASYIRQTRGA